jgi:hypothetical protein
MYHTIEEIWQGEVGMGESMPGIWIEPTQIEHHNEDEVYLKFGPQVSMFHKFMASNLKFKSFCWIPIHYSSNQ